jgi:hypothetical protein
MICQHVIQEFRSFPVRKVTNLSHNTKAIDIGLPSPKHETVKENVFVNDCD